MAERMAKVPHTSGVEGNLRSQAKGKLAGSFVRFEKDGTMNLHVVEPAKISQWSSQKVHAFVSLADKVFVAQEDQRKSLAKLRRPNFLQTATKASDISRVTNLVNGLKTDLQAGGDAAAKSLQDLINLVGTSGAADTMRYSGVLSKAADVLESESAPDSAKGLAGSLITLLTDMPVSAETSDISTGGSGHVTIVLPSPQRIYGHAAFAQLASAGLPEYPMASQTSGQAETPTVIHINFDVPHAGASFAQKSLTSRDAGLPVFNIHIPEAQGADAKHTSQIEEQLRARSDAIAALAEEQRS
jgi:hypothetical protein